MEKLKAGEKLYTLYKFEKEEEFENIVVENAAEIFGPKRVYLNIKRRIGIKGKKGSIPDGYLIDFSRRKQPRLYVIENEISSHDLFSHIGQQILQFSFSFDSDKQGIVKMLIEEIRKDQELQNKINSFLSETESENIDALISFLVHDIPFQAIVVIDELSEDLINVLEKFTFPVERIELKTFKSKEDDYIYQFEPLLSDVEESMSQVEPSTRLDISELDTIVVPAREKGFKEVFLGQNRWYAIRISETMIPQIKYIAGYQIRPLSAITHWAAIHSIESWGDSGKYVVNFYRPAEKIGPIKLVKGGRITPLYGPRYTNSRKISKAKNLDDVF